MTSHLPRAAALFAALTLVVSASAQPPLPPPRPLPDTPEVKQDKTDQAQPGIKVADKGPIHEAFAQPGADVRGKGMTSPKAPPPPVPEEPPETKPDGENVKWVPGYWQWDTEKQDHIWISGFWRNVPAGRDWQAGKWTEKNGQWHYAPGFWRPTAMNSWRIDLPEPPKSVESGPSTPPDNPDAVWIPGAWEYRNERFVWRAGYWAHPNGNQMWQPGQYVESGSGYAYVPGYWDYPLEDRGLLYAPVYFSEPLWQNPGWCFRPRMAIGFGGGWGGWGTGGAFGSLFIGSGFNNFCYGNFNSPWGFGGGSWLGIGSPFWSPVFSLGFGISNSFCGWGGCQPWWCTPKGFCNPTWNNYCWLNKNNPNWATNVKTAQVARAVGAAPRQLAVAPPNGTAQRPLALGSPGVGGAVQAAARSAATNVKSQPIIQPASQLVKASQTAKGNLNPSARPNLPSRPGNAPDVRAGSNPAVGANSGAARLPQATPPVHAGAVNITRGSGDNPGTVTGGGQPAARPTGVAQQPVPNTPQVVPGRPDRPSVGLNPRGPNLPASPGGSQPVIRSGSQPNTPQPGPAIQPGNATTIRPAAPSNPAPVIRPPAGNPAPIVRPQTPNLPSVRPTAPPVIRSAPVNPGIGRSMPNIPSARPPIGGGGARPPAGGGARPGGGGGARPGGKR